MAIYFAPWCHIPPSCLGELPFFSFEDSSGSGRGAAGPRCSSWRRQTPGGGRPKSPASTPKTARTSGVRVGDVAASGAPRAKNRLRVRGLRRIGWLRTPWRSSTFETWGAGWGGRVGGSGGWVIPAHLGFGKVAGGSIAMDGLLLACARKQPGLRRIPQAVQDCRQPDLRAFFMHCSRRASGPARGAIMSGTIRPFSVNTTSVRHGPSPAQLDTGEFPPPFETRPQPFVQAFTTNRAAGGRRCFWHESDSRIRRPSRSSGSALHAAPNLNLFPSLPLPGFGAGRRRHSDSSLMLFLFLDKYSTCPTPFFILRSVHVLPRRRSVWRGTTYGLWLEQAGRSSCLRHGAASCPAGVRRWSADSDFRSVQTYDGRPTSGISVRARPEYTVVRVSSNAETRYAPSRRPISLPKVGRAC